MDRTIRMVLPRQQQSYGPSAGPSGRKRARVDEEITEQDPFMMPGKNISEEAYQLEQMSQYGRGDTRNVSGMGSAWEGQKASLQSDAFQHNQMLNMKDDIHTTIFTSAHVMGQGGNICDTWTKVPAFCDVLATSMGHLTGNTHAGQANLFNQYYLCKLKKFRIQFKDIVVCLETSTSIGMQVMSDVITEWRKRPQAQLLDTGAGVNIISQPNSAEYQDWWGDWRPATDGCVTFDFEVNAGEVPAWIASTLVDSVGLPSSYKDPTKYMDLAQFLYGFPASTDQGCNPPNISLGALVMAGPNTLGRFALSHGSAGTAPLAYHPYLAAKTMNWMDYFFEWRARNCPNATSGANTSARYNVQIDAEWDMSYRLTAIPTLFRPPPIREKYDDEANVD